MKTPQITAWSYSRLNVYEECPRKAKYKFIDKLKEPDSPAMQRGLAVHGLAQQYTEGKLPSLPDDLRNFDGGFEALKAQRAMCEAEWAFTHDWQPTGWFDSNAWLRVKMDCSFYDLEAKVFRLIDHKTGRENEKHKDQLSLYGLAGFMRMSNATTVRAELWYLDSGVDVSQEYTQDHVPELLTSWKQRAEPMLNDTYFAAKPGTACRWCSFSRSKGGPCEF